jgi:membrane-associated protease RseP (regulator of RpoE activity)
MGQVVIFDGGPATSVQTIDASTQVSLYPNPANDLVNIITRGKEFNVMNVYDVLGHVVYTTKLNQAINNYDLNTSSFSQGIYQVQLSGENISVMKSIIIQK